MKIFKKILLIILTLFLFLISWIKIDRSLNVRNYYNDDRGYQLIITDSIWMNPPNGLWLQLDETIYKPMDAIIFVEKYDPILNTWKDITSANTFYTYHDEAGQPLILQIQEYEIDPRFLDVDIYPLTNHETINHINVSYGDINNNEFQINLESETKMIKISFPKLSLEILKPIIQQAWEIIQK